MFIGISTHQGNCRGTISEKDCSNCTDVDVYTLTQFSAISPGVNVVVAREVGTVAKYHTCEEIQVGQ